MCAVCLAASPTKQHLVGCVLAAAAAECSMAAFAGSPAARKAALGAAHINSVLAGFATAATATSPPPPPSRKRLELHPAPAAPALSGVGIAGARLPVAATPVALSACCSHAAAAAAAAAAAPRHQQHQPQRAPSASPLRAARCGQPADEDAGAVASGQLLPAPTAVLEFPPELEAAGGGSSADAPTQLQHRHPAHPQQQQQPQARHSHSMSGRRLSLRVDIPVGLDWLAGLPAHAPALGEGRLEVILGPMFAGKTSALLNRVKEVSSSSSSPPGSSSSSSKVHVAVKSSKDARYSSHWVVSHDGRCMRCYTADSLAQFKLAVGPAWAKLQVLAIDEGQFFPDLLEFCQAAVDRDGKHVIVAGLAGDFRRRRFGQVLDLLPLADRVTQLTSKCGFCDADALFSLRLAAGGPQEVVGGAETYRPACRRCYLQLQQHADA